MLEGTRTIAGSRHVRESMQQQQSPSAEQSLQSQLQDLYTLLVYIEELGRVLHMDGPSFDLTGVNWNTFIDEHLSSSSLGTTSIPSAGIDLHQMGMASEAGMTGLSNS
jgi:hypothetical protein